MQKQLEQARGEAERATRRASASAKAKAEQDKEKIGKDEKKAVERKVIVTSPNLDSKTRADLEKMIKEKMGEKFNSDDLKKIIHDSIDPAKMKQIQVQVQEIIRKTMDEKKRDMDKTFEDLRNSLESQHLIIEKKQAESNRQQTETRTRATQSLRDNELRDVQRRLERLEQRLDKVISSLESQQRERRARPNDGN
jgi:hypothetical protein